MMRRPYMALLRLCMFLLLLPLLAILDAPLPNAAHLPLPPPIQCTPSGCTVQSYQGIWYDRKPCHAARAVYPTSEAELFDAVAWASRSGSKVRVVSKGSHSLPKLVCPGGHQGLLISTQFYNSLIHVNHSALTVTAHAGVMLRHLLDAIAAQGLSLPHTPYWQGVSVAGMIATGAHGSGMWHKGSAPHDYVVAIRLIIPSSPEHGYAQILDLVDGQDDLNAARLSLGVLGAVSTVTFQLEPMFKRSVSLHIKGDETLEHDILQFAQDHEFGGLNWYPGTGKVLFKLDDRVSIDTEGDGAYHLALVDKMDVKVIESLRDDAETLEETQNMDNLCESESMFIDSRHKFGDGLVNNVTGFMVYPVVGFNHNIQTSGGCEIGEASPQITTRMVEIADPHEHPLHSDNGIKLATDTTLSTCFFNPLFNKSIFFFDIAISIPTSKVKDAIVEIKKLKDIEPEVMCMIGTLGGFWIRFMAKSKAYLGEREDSVVFEFIHYRAKEADKPRFREDLFEEMEQILVSKFGGKPHWGKNRPLAFEGMHSRTVAMEKFLEVKKRFDPANLFSNEWTDAILGHDSTTQSYHDHCALEGLCVCREDSHCHPTKGYFCREGRVFKEARVCRHETKEASV